MNGVTEPTLAQIWAAEMTDAAVASQRAEQAAKAAFLALPISERDGHDRCPACGTPEWYIGGAAPNGPGCERCPEWAAPRLAAKEAMLEAWRAERPPASAGTAGTGVQHIQPGQPIAAVVDTPTYRISVQGAADDPTFTRDDVTAAAVDAAGDLRITLADGGMMVAENGLYESWDVVPTPV